MTTKNVSNVLSCWQICRSCRPIQNVNIVLYDLCVTCSVFVAGFLHYLGARKRQLKKRLFPRSIFESFNAQLTTTISNVTRWLIPPQTMTIPFTLDNIFLLKSLPFSLPYTHFSIRKIDVKSQLVSKQYHISLSLYPATLSVGPCDAGLWMALG